MRLREMWMHQMAQKVKEKISMMILEMMSSSGMRKILKMKTKEI